MDSKDVIGVLELGDTNLKCLIFQIINGNK